MNLEATAGSPGPGTDASAAGELCDVRIPRDRSRWSALFLVLLIGLPALCVLAVLGNAILGAATSIVCGFIFVIGWSRVERGWKRSIQADVQREVSLHPDAPPAELIDHIFGTRGRPSVPHYLSSLAKTLAEAGRTDLSIRNAAAEAATTLNPITVDFEARPLSEKQTQLEDFDTGACRASAPVPTGQRQAAAKTAPRLRRRTGAAWYVWVLAFGVAAYFVAFTIDFLVSGRVDWGLAFCLSMIAFSGLALTLGSGWSFRRQWLVAPGGVILRESSFVRREWKLHVFDRRQSVLIAHRINRYHWVVFIADGEMQRQATISANEAEFLLRAWLSPLRPPPLERLSDLA